MQTTTETANQAPSTMPIEVINLILHWIYGWSGSDYLELLTSHMMAAVPLNSRHLWASVGRTLIEAHDPGPVGRKCGDIKDEISGKWEWRYSIGWGGTVVVITPSEINVISYEYIPGGENREKGRCTITINRHVHWDVEEGKGHSWGRLKDLMVELSKSTITDETEDGELVGFRQVKVPDEVVNYVHNMEIGGGF